MTLNNVQQCVQHQHVFPHSQRFHKDVSFEIMSSACKSNNVSENLECALNTQSVYLSILSSSLQLLGYNCARKQLSEAGKAKRHKILSHSVCHKCKCMRSENPPGDSVRVIMTRTGRSRDSTRDKRHEATGRHKSCQSLTFESSSVVYNAPRYSG